MRLDEFSSPAFDLTLQDDGTLVVRGSALTVHTSATWYIVAEAPVATPSAPAQKAAPTAKQGKRHGV